MGCFFPDSTPLIDSEPDGTSWTQSQLCLKHPFESVLNSDRSFHCEYSLVVRFVKI